MTAKGANKLAIFLPSLNGGGAERVMLNVAHGLVEYGCAVDLLLAQANGPYLSQVHETIRIVDLKASRVLSSLPTLIRYLRRERPVVILSVLNHVNIVALLARRLARVTTRVVVSEHNTLSRASQNASRWRSRFVPPLIKRFYPWADSIVAVSKGVADDLAKQVKIPRERIQVIYNPVVTPELREGAKSSLDHVWFMPGQPPVVLAVGRLKTQKDFPTLIRAFAQVRQRHPARLMILGEGPDRPALEALVKQLGLEGEVAMPGFVENPYAYMRRASVFVLSSLWEGLPTVLIEALYCGAPIIATDCPSGPREILAGGGYGILVPVGDVMALAQAIEAGLAGETPHPTEESWQPYSQEVVVDQYISLLFNGQA